MVNPDLDTDFDHDFDSDLNLDHSQYVDKVLW